MLTGFSSCLHNNNGYTTPLNEPWKDVIVLNEDAKVYGGSITEHHWERDKRFEERLMFYYSKMGREEYTTYTMDGYLLELTNAFNGIRSNNLSHLRRIFKKAYEEIYIGVGFDENVDKVVNDGALKMFLATEGKLR